MAVARVKFQTGRDARVLAKRVEGRMAEREILRAADRPGLQAELTGDEIRAIIAELDPDRIPERIMAALRKAEEELTAAEKFEATRPKIYDMILRHRERINGEAG